MQKEDLETAMGIGCQPGNDSRLSMAEKDLEDLVQLLAEVCQVPFAAINLKGSEGQWFKAQLGNHSFTEGLPDLLTVHQSLPRKDLLVIENVSNHLLFSALPAKTVNPIQFYAGMPLFAPNGEVAGTLWIADSRNRRLSGHQAFAFRTMGRQAMNVLALCMEKEEREVARYEQEKFVGERVAFLKAYSNELRKPLNDIMGMAYWLIQDQPRPEHLKLMNTLRFTTENLMGLISDTLDYHQLQAGKLVLEANKFCLLSTIRQLGESVQFMADLKEIKLEIDTPEVLPPLLGDSGRLSQVLSKLLSNAVKFTEDGKVGLKVKKVKETEDSLSLAFRVTDTGKGISDEKIKTIFNGFKGVSPQINSRHGGTGLGLAISRNLLQLMGSSLKVRSWPGKGSCFEFSLTLKKTHGKCPEKIQAMPLATSANYLEKKKILLVEDNRVNQLVTSKFLQKWGFKTRLASNGEEAVLLAKEQDFDLILMDLQMPGMNGSTAAGIIRSLSKHYTNVPILVLTATGASEFDNEPGKAVFNTSLMKPFKPEKLYNTIHNYLYAAQAEAGLNPLQVKVDEISQGDEKFKKQLIPLYLESFNGIISDLNSGRLQEVDYLRHVRHKQKATFKMLGLDKLENALLKLQEQLDKKEKPGHEVVSIGLVAEINQLTQQVVGQLESIV